MIKGIIEKKSHGGILTKVDYYSVVKDLMQNGITADSTKFFMALNSFGMTKKEVLYLSCAMRDSGRTINYTQFVFEKHSTGGVGDSSSLVVIPIMAGLGYKIIKMAGKSMIYTNGTADRFKSIPNFTTNLTNEEIFAALDKTNACVLSHNGDICPADALIYNLREKYNLTHDINLIAASIASRVLASGAKMVLVDIKFGYASLVDDYAHACKLSKILKYIFKNQGVKLVCVLTDASQTFGQSMGNAIEVKEAVDVLKGKKCFLRDVSVMFATEMIASVNKNMNPKDIQDMVNSVLDTGVAYQKFLEIVSNQKGDAEAVANDKIFNQPNTVKLLSTKSGYVYNINIDNLGEITSEITKHNNDNSTAIQLHAQVGDYVHEGDNLITIYCKDDNDIWQFEKYLLESINLTEVKVDKPDVIRRILR